MSETKHNIHNYIYIDVSSTGSTMVWGHVSTGAQKGQTTLALKRALHIFRIFSGHHRAPLDETRGVQLS